MRKGWRKYTYMMVGIGLYCFLGPGGPRVTYHANLRCSRSQSPLDIEGLNKILKLSQDTPRHRGILAKGDLSDIESACKAEGEGEDVPEDDTLLKAEASGSGVGVHSSSGSGSGSGSVEVEGSSSFQYSTVVEPVRGRKRERSIFSEAFKASDVHPYLPPSLASLLPNPPPKGENIRTNLSNKRTLNPNPKARKKERKKKRGKNRVRSNAGGKGERGGEGKRGKGEGGGEDKRGGKGGVLSRKEKRIMKKKDCDIKRFSKRSKEIHRTRDIIRSNWDVGDWVMLYSKSQRLWTYARIANISRSENPLDDVVLVKYPKNISNPNSPMSKKQVIRRSPDLRVSLKAYIARIKLTNTVDNIDLGPGPEGLHAHIKSVPRSLMVRSLVDNTRIRVQENTRIVMLDGERLSDPHHARTKIHALSGREQVGSVSPYFTVVLESPSFPSIPTSVPDTVSTNISNQTITKELYSRLLEIRVEVAPSPMDLHREREKRERVDCKMLIAGPKSASVAVREQEDVHSPLVSEICGERVVWVERIRGRRAYITSPIRGWISLYSVVSGEQLVSPYSSSVAFNLHLQSTLHKRFQHARNLTMELIAKNNQRREDAISILKKVLDTPRDYSLNMILGDPRRLFNSSQGTVERQLDVEMSPLVNISGGHVSLNEFCSLDSDNAHLLISILAEKGEGIRAYQLIQWMHTAGIDVPLEAYNDCFRGLSEYLLIMRKEPAYIRYTVSTHWQSLQALYRRMCKRGIYPDQTSVELVVTTLHCLHKYNHVLEMFNDISLQQLRVNVTLNTYKCFLEAAVKADKWEQYQKHLYSFAGKRLRHLDTGSVSTVQSDAARLLMQKIPSMVESVHKIHEDYVQSQIPMSRLRKGSFDRLGNYIGKIPKITQPVRRRVVYGPGGSLDAIAKAQAAAGLLENKATSSLASRA
ncbi:hypothetical protein AAMO2058_001714400 [Amorphochlora amoebiformis]